MKQDVITKFINIFLIGIFLFSTSIPITHAEDVYFYHNDHLGSPLAMTNMAGEVVWRRDYQPFGEEIDVTVDPPPTGPTPSANTHTYTGKEFDSETGLYYYGARYYDPTIGRFISVDPAGADPSNPQMWNRYAYTLNNPYKYVDPDGRLSVFVHGTWSSKDKAWSRDFVSSVASDLGEKREPKFLEWSGGNNKEARTEGAEGLAKLINNWNFAQGENLNIIAHSHGGNVAIEALPGIKRAVDNLILLGTPRRYDYKIGAGETNNAINAYSWSDSVQPIGGSVRRLGFAGIKRKEPFVKNIQVNGMLGHSELHTIKAWKQIKKGL